MALHTDEVYNAREHYTKYEYRIPMRDGVKLFTSVLVPKDASMAYPFLIVRSPFGVGPYGPDEYPPASLQSEALLKAGYIWVRQDVRGRRMAEGEFTHMTPPPNVEVPFDYGTEDGYEFFLKVGPVGNAASLFGASNPTWDELVAHPTYDEFWQSRAIWRHLKNIRCAVLTVGGWYDAEDLMGPFRVYHAIKRNNPDIANGIVMGPWVHGGWARHNGRRLGSVDFAADTAKFYREKILLPFFEFHLKDKGDPKLPEAYVFETGTN